MPNPNEVALLRVAGVDYQDWETVYVQHRWMDGWPTFRFTATEGGKLPFDWAKLQFKPGDSCTILLGGQLGVTGIITQRQVAYASTEHGVQLSGVGVQWAAATSSVPSENGKNNFDNQPISSIFTKVVSSVGGSPKIVGTPSSMKFEVMQSQPGEPVFDFLDRIARMRNAKLGSDHLGNLLLIGDNSPPITQNLIEGQNILKMQCVFSSEFLFNEYKLNSQAKVKDDKSPLDTAEIVAVAMGDLPGLHTRKMEIPAEHPSMTPQEAQMRAQYEALQRSGTKVTANVTVQGWLRDGKNLWKCGDGVYLNSPMCPLALTMLIKTATFTQDTKGGTLTQLECVLPSMLGAQEYKLDESGKQTPTPAPKSTSDPTVNA
jgi:prophage tail gpP-like protein